MTPGLIDLVIQPQLQLPFRITVRMIIRAGARVKVRVKIGLGFDYILLTICRFILGITHP